MRDFMFWASAGTLCFLGLGAFIILTGLFSTALVVALTN